VRFRYRRAWRLPLDVDDLWRRIERTDQYADWWPWLRDADLPRLEAGTTARFSVVPPLPYRLAITLELVDVDPPWRIDATVGGDLVGSASLDLSPGGPSGSVVSLRWDVDVARPGLQRLARFGQPVLQWGHEMVVRSAIRGFTDAQGLDRRGVARVAIAGQSRRRRPVGQIVSDGLRAGAVAGVVSGLPSTATAVVRRTPTLQATRAAGTVLGAPTLPRALVAHTALSLGWGVLLSATLPRRWRVVGGALAGAGIAALDLGVVAPRRFPAVAALRPGPQVADHLLYGAMVGLVLDRRTARSDGSPDDRLDRLADRPGDRPERNET
jgi:hypothetical protein